MTKLFGGNYDGVPGAGPGGGTAAAPDWVGGRLSHGSTLDSVEWDSCIRENCALIPSYSEALLMDEGGVDGDAVDDQDAVDEHRSLVSPLHRVGNARRAFDAASQGWQPPHSARPFLGSFGRSALCPSAAAGV